MIVRLKGVETPLIATSELKISGHHNVINALCAATAALAVGADVDGVCRGLASFQPLEHRVEPCGEIDGVRYVNDSKATNTDAVEKALTAFPDDDVILLLGGHDKARRSRTSRASLWTTCARSSALAMRASASPPLWTRPMSMAMWISPRRMTYATPWTSPVRCRAVVT